MSNSYELTVQVAYLDVLKRYPDTTELSTYSPQIESGTLTLTSLKTVLQGTSEYLKTIGLYAGDTSYDNLWTISGSNLCGTNFNGLTLANGKLALITSSNYTDIDKALISTNYDYNNLGTYTNNVTETFKYSKVNLFNRDESLVSYSFSNQSLNMYSANFSSSYTVSSNNINVDVLSETRVLRQYPYCTMQTLTLTSDKTANIDLYHTINTPKNITDVRYNNNLINTTVNNSNVSLYFFQANGFIDDIEKNISSCCGYVFSNVSWTNKGYNIAREDTDIAFTQFNVSLTANVEAKLHILTSTMTELDFKKPDIETQRILINVLTYNPDDIIEQHVNEWSSLWDANITITPKANITSTELSDINNLNRLIKFSLYNIYSCVRDDINVEINPLNISTIDITGHIFWSGELWLIPVLLFLKPNAAKSLLDYRYYQLANAQKLAAAHGYNGSKYPYENDNVAYKNVYWNSISPLQIFNTALISISVWNYYRVMRDYDWLEKKGYEILKNNADFFVSKLELNTNLTDNVVESTLSTGGFYEIKSVIGMDNYVGDNNIMTNYLVKLALNCAIQAKYELSYVHSIDWQPYADNIYLPTGLDSSNYVLLKTNSTDSPNNPELLDSLLMLHPYYSSSYFGLSVNYDYGTIIHNINSYVSRLSPTYSNNYFNKLIVSALWARVAQEDIKNINLDTAHPENNNTPLSDIINFKSYLDDFINNSTLIPWKTFYNSRNVFNFNDIAVSSMFILNFLTSIVGLTIQGKVDATKFYLEEFGIVSSTTGIQPKTWQNIIVNGISYFQHTGNTYTSNTFTLVNKDYTIINPLSYP